MDAYSTQVSYKQPTPPDEQLHVRSQVVNITEPGQAGSGKTSVQVCNTNVEKHAEFCRCTPSPGPLTSSMSAMGVPAVVAGGHVAARGATGRTAREAGGDSDWIVSENRSTEVGVNSTVFRERAYCGSSPLSE